MNEAAAEPISVERGVAPLRAVLEGPEATEILISSFTANLAFFSRAAAGRARARGARVTLLSDLLLDLPPDLLAGAQVERSRT